MRVTQKMLGWQTLNSINNNLSRIQKIQEHINTGKKINRPSDDPVGLSYSLRYRSEIRATEQYQRNLDSAISWLDVTDTTLSQVNDVLQRARELAVKGANGTNPDQALEAIAAEMDELADELWEIANTRFNGKYIFNGQRTDQPPYPFPHSYLGDEHAGDSFDKGQIKFEVSRGVTVQVNFHAGEIFGSVVPGDGGDPPKPAENVDADEDNAFYILQTLSQALRDADFEAVDDMLGRLDARIDKVLEKWSELGAKRNRVDLIEHRLQDNDLNIQALLSKTEDVDYAEAITNLKMEENVYMASLSVGARIIQPSLIDFLR